MPADWFPRESHVVLCGYCRHVVRAQRLDAEIEGHGKDIDSTLLERLYSMAEKEGRAVLAHARSLRLTNQSRIEPKAAARSARNMIGPSYYELMALDE